MRSATRVLFVLAALGGVSAACSSSPSTSMGDSPDGGSSTSSSGGSSGSSGGSSSGSANSSGSGSGSSSGGSSSGRSGSSGAPDGSVNTNEGGSSGSGSDAATLPGWTLTWSDEFDTADGTQPNPMYWNYDLGDGTSAGAPGWGNDELESYTNKTDNVVIQGGNLVITAKVNTDSSLTCATCGNSSTCTYKTCGYTSGRIHTQGKFSQTYGRFEARIKIPAGSGVWPAFWMMGEQTTQANWPQYGEIDVMENAGSMPAQISGTIHGPGGSATYTDNGLTKAYNLTSGNFSDDFHVFAMEWDVGTISFFVDGSMYFTVTTANVNAVGGGATWPFDNNPNFVLLNFAVDSGNFGDPPNSMTKWPQEMLVDYVRVYKKQ